MKQHLGINHQLHILANRSTRKFNETFLGDDITGKQGGILHYLLLRAGKKDVYQRDIEENFSIRRSSVTSLLQKLEDKNYITRESVAGDARLKRIVLTPKALKFRTNVVQGTYDFEDVLLDGISEADIQVWQNVTTQMIHNLDSKKTGSGKV
ncbi:MarR family winged helix-turn-helix transcriptional regulator [Pediococcus siamensis]|uniref:MarR family winged helix-turn-helix transcriptional regulator n=1 Tax=Pediococcus siamensis TaxID=381829 RepID=UPI0039A28A5A